MISIFFPIKIFFTKFIKKKFKICYTRRLTESLKTYRISEDLQNLRRLYGVIFIKMNYGFLFGHKEPVVISLAF